MIEIPNGHRQQQLREWIRISKKPGKQIANAIEAVNSIISIANDGLGVMSTNVWGEKQRESVQWKEKR